METGEGTKLNLPVVARCLGQPLSVRDLLPPVECLPIVDQLPDLARHSKRIGNAERQHNILGSVHRIGLGLSVKGTGMAASLETLEVELRGQSERISTMEAHFERRFDEHTKEIGNLSTLIHGDEDSPGLRGEMLETKVILKHIRVLVTVLVMLALSEYSPKLFAIVSNLFSH